MNHVPYMRAFHEKGVTRHHQHPADRRPRRDGNQLVATLGSDFAEGWRARAAGRPGGRRARHAPLDELYLALKPLSKNRGAVDYERLVGGGDPFPARAADGTFILLRIGDAVASRNIHAAIYDGIRFALRI